MASSNFRRVFIRGLALTLPTILTIAILIYAYRFVRDTIAEPINGGIRELVLRSTHYPAVSDEEIESYRAQSTEAQRAAWTKAAGSDEFKLRRLVERDARRVELRERWSALAFPLDLIGLVVAVSVIYVVGGLLSNYIGRKLFEATERLLMRLPVVKLVYPSVKQVTDFLFARGSEERIKFSRVVAIEYPRKGIWSIGLVTGDTLKPVQGLAGRACVTVFLPSCPTPFTGYVVTIPREDAVDLPLTIDEVMRYLISGGVVVPPRHAETGQPIEAPTRLPEVPFEPPI